MLESPRCIRKFLLGGREFQSGGSNRDAHLMETIRHTEMDIRLKTNYVVAYDTRGIISAKEWKEFLVARAHKYCTRTRAKESPVL